MTLLNKLNGPSRKAMVLAGLGLAIVSGPALAEDEVKASMQTVSASDADLLKIENDPRENLEVDSEADLVVERFSKNAGQQDFASAVRNAVLTHPRFGAFRSRVDAREASVREARSEYFPTLSLGVTGRASEFGSSNQDLDGRVRTGGYQQDVEAVATLSQPIYDGGAIAWQVDQQRALSAAERAQLEQDTSDLALDAIDAWYGYLRETMRFQLAQRSYAAHQTILARVKLRYESGAASVTDLSRSEARMADAKAVLVTREASRQISIERYREMFDDVPASDVGMVAVESLVPNALGDAVAVALDESPTIDRAHSERLAAEAALGVARAENMPNLRLEVNAVRFDMFSDQAANGATARLVARYNFFLGGGRIARNDRAKAEAARASYQEAAIKRALDRDVRIAWERMKALGMRLVMLERALRANEEARELIREQFKFEGRTLFDLLEAERDVFDAADRYLSGMIDFEMSRYEMAAQVGTLPDLLNLFGAAAPENDLLLPDGESEDDLRDDMGDQPAPSNKPIGTQSPAQVSVENDAPIEDQSETAYSDLADAASPQQGGDQAVGGDSSTDAIKDLFKPRNDDNDAAEQAEKQNDENDKNDDRVGAIEQQSDEAVPVKLAGVSESITEDVSEDQSE